MIRRFKNGSLITAAACGESSHLFNFKKVFRCNVLMICFVVSSSYSIDAESSSISVDSSDADGSEGPPRISSKSSWAKAVLLKLSSPKHNKCCRVFITVSMGSICSFWIGWIQWKWLKSPLYVASFLEWSSWRQWRLQYRCRYGNCSVGPHHWDHKSERVLDRWMNEHPIWWPKIDSRRCWVPILHSMERVLFVQCISTILLHHRSRRSTFWKRSFQDHP